jgi:hypothetical protein
MRRLACLVLLATVASGCTSGSSDEPAPGAGPSDQARPSAGASASTPVPTGPDCDTAWRAGDVLDRDYALCVQDGAAGVQDVTECQDGPPLIVFDDELFGRPGGRIQAPSASPVQDTEEYGEAYRECTGG